MIYKRFGKTEIQMPVLSLGLMRSMHSWQNLPFPEVPTSSQRNLEDIVTAAMDIGINHFETARAYGTSEKQLGKILAKLPRQKITVQTKIRPYQDEQDFINDFNKSLAQLGLDYVDLLTIHGLNDHQALWHSCRDNGCLAAARHLQRQQKVKHIGFSSHGSCEVIKEAIRHQKDGGFDYLNVHWYYIYQVNLTAIKEARKRDMGVFIISPTDKGGMLNTPSAKLSKLCSPLSPILLNDLFCLSRPEINTISIGAASPNDFDEHSKVIDLLKNKEGADLLRKIDARLGDEMEKLCGHRGPDHLWPQLPAWQNTPGYINIPMIIWLYNLCQGWDMLEYGKRRYQQLGKDMPWVAGNDAARVADYDFSKAFRNSQASAPEIINTLKEAHRTLSA